MPVTTIVVVLCMVGFALLAAKFAVLLGLVVACATFYFPVGLIGMVGAGVLLLFLLVPRQQAGR